MNEHVANLFCLFSGIDYLSDQNKTIKITPYHRHRCSCTHSLVVETSNIAWTENTGEQFFCCGKMHSIVKILFKPDASVPLSEAIKLVTDVIQVENKLMLWKKHIKMAGELLSPF
ncbi:MAG: hypothetical protein ABI761_13495 [Saprospiraceae bacterium]